MAVMRKPVEEATKECACGACGTTTCEPNTGCPGRCDHHNTILHEVSTGTSLSQRITCQDCGYWDEINSLSIWDIKCY
ncbi:MAG: hypothetical protein CL833_05250 [Crocinitomicaceae bacterium]|nr:hypothetical protein [Crocinitomicaceae bacterium]